MTKTKHPNKGHSPNNGQRPMYQSVRYSETPLYIYTCAKHEVKVISYFVSYFVSYSLILVILKDIYCFALGIAEL